MYHMAESLKTSINSMLSEFYRSANEKYVNAEKALNDNIDIIKTFPFVKELIDENNRLKFENKKLALENAQYSKYDQENINLEVNEKEEIDEDSNEESIPSDELSVGGENQDEQLLIN